jgi:hypothetical protein
MVYIYNILITEDSRHKVDKHGTDEWWVKSVLPEDGDGASPRNIVFKSADTADGPRDYIEDSRLLGCDAEEVNGSPLKMTALHSFKTSGTVHPMA